MEASPHEKGAHVMHKAILVIALCLTALVQAQEQRRPPQEVWNEIFTKRQGRAFPHNKFLEERIKGRQPGTALDIGMGEGRNALFLATQGWEVTGFDISDVGVQLAREAAQQRGVKLKAVVEDADRFDYGRQRWDLVVYTGGDGPPPSADGRRDVGGRSMAVYRTRPAAEAVPVEVGGVAP